MENTESIVHIPGGKIDGAIESKDTKDTKDNLENIKNSLGRKKVNMKKIFIIILAILLATLIAFFGYTFFTKGDSVFVSPLGNGGSLSQANMVVNPLTGERVDANEAESWIGQRPLAVMINNHIDARPQSGLIYADLVYEIVAEGGITRLVPFFLSETPEKIGPVRSTREYYLVLVKELGDAMLMHIGWSPQALTAIETWPVRSLGRGGGSFWRDNPRNVATEHTAYVNGVELRQRAVELGWEGVREFKVWEFKDSKGYESYPAASHLEIDFWHKGDYSAIFDYDEKSNVYLRSMGYDAGGNPIEHRDQETNEQIAISNIIVQFVKESPIPNDPKGRLDYELVGSGTGLVFLDGVVIDITWSKEDRDSRTIFYDTDGQEITFNRGMFWISVVPDRNIDQVVYN